MLTNAPTKHRMYTRARVRVVILSDPIRCHRSRCRHDELEKTNRKNINKEKTERTNKLPCSDPPTHFTRLFEREQVGVC